MGWTSVAAKVATAGGTMASPLVLPLVSLLLVTLLALAPYRRRLIIGIRTLPRDIIFMYRFGSIALISRLMHWKNDSVVRRFLQNVRKWPDKPCFRFEDDIWTYKDVDAYSNKIARVFKEHGLKPGDAVALMMENRPEYVCTWLGLARLRVVTALINTNLRDKPLLHSLSVAKARLAIVSSALAPALRDVAPELPLFVLGGGDRDALSAAGRSLDELLKDQEPVALEGEPLPGYRDPLLFIYTSGTTGLPKAAVMLNSRYLLLCVAAEQLLALRRDDVFYTPLPQYHTAGGALGAGSAVVNGHTVVMRSKFSASAYWPDCVRYGCTVGQYIGEICRYVLAVSPRPVDTQHCVRLMLGNGMRPQIWKDFVERFQVPQVCELYGATEGNTNIVNLDNTVGAVGFLPRCVPLSVLPLGLIRVDEASGQPVRRADGLCQRADIGEPGMCVGIIDRKNAMREFHGYVNEKESQKKIVTNVFSKGDEAFLSGDILVMDEYGYLYFKDRTGDTFRWKGENVSTAEVEAVISNVIDLKDASVYGVEVPGAEGRAGMAAVADPDGRLDLTLLAAGVERSLPAYARPIFLRITPRIELTGTFKIKKIDLQRDGFDPSRVPPSDCLYILRAGAYQPLTHEVHQQIVDGTLRL